MAYKPGYSEAHSPTYRQGVEDGERDAGLVGSCPSWPPIGPDPDLTGGAMYDRGYESVPQIVHMPCDNCRDEAS